ncbi:hypothetical protein [Methylorubrum extorquens]|uniref:Uncharacterized protein n=1 Tax=Methylorubrum extorquens TaxID=408 RepID=A0AAX3WAY8_METEX|nr:MULTISPECIES: hypothetical protein [Methylobacteriaceae]WHQ68477.1 hypothetical protein KEC54_19095 [Methylorubrum extorquens]
MLEHRTMRAVERSFAQAATHRASGRLTGAVADAFRAIGRCGVDASCAA